MASCIGTRSPRRVLPVAVAHHQRRRFPEAEHLHDRRQALSAKTIRAWIPGFTIFYAGINVGALFSSLICGYLGEVWGWGWGFGAAGIGMVAGLGMFITGQKYLQGHAESKHPERLRRRVFGPLNVEWCIYLGAVLGLPVIWLLMQLG